MRLGAKQVYAEFFIALPLRFYDLREKQFSMVIEANSSQDLARMRGESSNTPAYVVLYADGVNRLRFADIGQSRIVFQDDRFMVLLLE